MDQKSLLNESIRDGTGLFDGPVVQDLKNKAFNLETSERTEIVAKFILNIIQASSSTFLLPNLILWIDQVRHEGIAPEFSLADLECFFEKTLIEDKHKIRAKIVGRFVPRWAYQQLFPIGNGRTFSGVHFVTAHNAPDLDTAVASFWGWADAFGCRLGSGPHLWNLPPGGARDQIIYLFNEVFGWSSFDAIAKEKSDLSRSAVEALGLGEWPRELGKKRGTVSFRDFSNLIEVPIDPSLDLISVVDHHPIDLKTRCVGTLLVADVSSCNVLLAEQSFLLNDLAQKKGWIDPKRERAEYYMYLMAILDDTDLLDRVTERDILCIKTLLKRLAKFDGLTIDPLKIDEGDKKELLASEPLRSYYLPVLQRQKTKMARALEEAVEGSSLALFADTKRQRGIARVGQAKLFSSHFPLFLNCRIPLYARFAKEAALDYQGKGLPLHMMMISTIRTPEEAGMRFDHLDELWVWLPQNKLAEDLFKSFLEQFRHAPGFAGVDLSFEPVCASTRLVEILSRCCVPERSTGDFDHAGQMVILRFPAGVVTSRKQSITPYLP